MDGNNEMENGRCTGLIPQLKIDVTLGLLHSDLFTSSWPVSSQSPSVQLTWKKKKLQVSKGLICSHVRANFFCMIPFSECCTNSVFLNDSVIWENLLESLFSTKHNNIWYSWCSMKELLIKYLIYIQEVFAWHYSNERKSVTCCNSHL